MEGNINFVVEYENHMKTITKVQNLIQRDLGYLFRYKDSYFVFMSSKIENFKLERLLKFGTQDFVELIDPIDWITMIGEEMGEDNPGRAKEGLKAFSNLSRYIQRNLNGLQLNESVLCMMRDQASKRIDSYITKISEKKMLEKVGETQG